jgi:hypothetical protein
LIYLRNPQESAITLTRRMSERIGLRKYCGNKSHEEMGAAGF